MKQWKLLLAALLALAVAAALPALAEGLESDGGEVVSAPAEEAVAELEDLLPAPEDADAAAPAVAAPSSVTIDATNFPDDAFRESVAEDYDGDNDGILSIEELNAVTTYYRQYSGIESLKGIELFPMLEEIHCNDNAITCLDVSKNTNLKKLDCPRNKITELIIGNNPNLTYLDCGENQLTTLDISGCTNLTKLFCSSNSISQLDLSILPSLENLACGANKLTSLDLSGHTALKTLYCQSNPITSLILGGCSSLEEVHCQDCKLTSLDLLDCPNLFGVECNNNLLTSLDLEHLTGLVDLNCSHNQLTGTLKLNAYKIVGLNCSFNQLTGLETSAAYVEYLYCQNNLLTSLTVKGNTEGYVDGLKLVDCSNNRLTRLTLDGNFYFLRFLYIQNNRLDEVDVGNCDDIKAIVAWHKRELSEDGKQITFISRNHVYLEDGTPFDQLNGDCLVSDITTTVKWGDRVLFQGQPRNIDECTATLSVKACTYTGSEQEPAVTVEFDGKKLAHGTDYTVSYVNNTDAGTASAYITGQGKYCDTMECTFTILPRKLSAAKVAKVPAQVYTGKAIKPLPTVTDKGVTLVKGTDYKLSFSNNKKVGVATITLTGKGNYTGTKKVKFRINPKPTAITKLTAGKKRFTVAWKKQASQTAGYQIQYGLKSTFAGAKKITVRNIGVVRKAVTRLAAGKTYFVRVRTYAKVNAKSYYSAWSETYMVTVKK